MTYNPPFHRIPILLFIFLLYTLVAMAQDTAALVTQVRLMGTVTQEKNYGAIADQTHTALVNAMGGREEMLAFIAAGMEDMAANGIRIDSVYFGDPGNFQQNEDIVYAFIPQVLVMTIPQPDQKMIVLSMLMAISDDGGNRWTFVDATGLDDAKLEYLFPDFQGNVPRPFTGKPIVLPESEVTSQLQRIWSILRDADTPK
ncbi:hypothetical protein [Parapedobacter koreensis]|uniref:Uncharacterized protein n=1 Tax=Parapedobacter koreensis TaxID=332977 RepID=A0A1H7PYW2_9SPHI|nr:hypothetical protein [Parapedobacter koreensis]SEL41020.1 hypothetical protein SAMN05421740_10589 [Parapedobacter koreensis]